MTFILSLGNNKQVIQISDRRLSYNGRLVDDESNKCGVLFCLNARMAFGYTGLARFGDFNTPNWLLKALHDSALPDYTIGEILERLKNNATNTFMTNSALKSANKKFKRLSIMFSGYLNLDGYIKQGFAVLSNYQNFENNISSLEAYDEFSIHYSSAREGVETPTLVQRVGNYSAMTDHDIDELRNLLLQNKPSSAIIGKAVSLVRDLADRSQSKGTIGKQLTSICIKSDMNFGVESNYYSEYEKRETYMPALVYLLPTQHMTVDNISIEPVDDDTPSLSIPIVGRNQPCPCGSKKKYKHCHGK